VAGSSSDRPQLTVARETLAGKVMIMAVKVRIPTPLQALTGQSSEVAAEGATVSDVLADLEQRYPGVRSRLYEDDGRLRRFVNLYVNDEDIRFLQGEETALGDGDELSIVPAIAGGATAGGRRRGYLPVAADWTQAPASEAW
jgi:molybdopterin synthase sulfur carrier subunit